ncbi:MAG: anthranilate synthase family protein [Candidatus Gracilibacteria bacterium]|nr:anthranilate synthase family protein [Candidatus Gracilibacteria bacterium]
MYKKPFTIIKKKGEDFLRYYTGELKKYNLLSEMEENKEQIFITPFSQAKERGFEVIENQEKIISILIDKEIQLTKKELEESFLNTEIILDGELNENYTKEDYSKIVDDIIKKEIGNGEGSNFCIAQKIKGKIKDFEINKALTIFDRIVESEFGSYMQFIFFDGNEFFIGASPERNVSVEKNIVRMNPISGTFRKSKYTNYKDFKNDFIPFLNDQKEINELFMCVDEELKMMSKICSSGGMVVGPILKEMANLIHTEYLLSGQTNMKKLDVFRESIWACTVVGSPIESAFKIVKKYENFDRRYYAGSICHMKEDLLDSSIMIRTINIKNDGNIEMFVGASLVKDSVGENEYHETKEKSKGVLNALLGIKKEKRSFLEKYYLDDEVQELIQKRNQNLSKTWFFKQDLENIKKKDEKILIINNEDDFTNMIAHILKISGYNIELKRFSNINIEDVKQSDITLIGPGPGNPLDNNEKMNKNIEIIDYLYKNNKKFFGICLGHQLICRYLKIEVKRKNTPTQGEQIEIDLYGNKEKVAFYNTFAGFYKENLDGIEFSKKEDGEIYSLKGENFFSFQFHPESILTQNGLNILNENLNRIIG